MLRFFFQAWAVNHNTPASHLCQYDHEVNLAAISAWSGLRLSTEPMSASRYKRPDQTKIYSPVIQQTEQKERRFVLFETILNRLDGRQVSGIS